MQQSRPPFRPMPLSAAENPSSLLESTDGQVNWVPMVGSSADFPIDIVRVLILTYILNPSLTDLHRSSSLLFPSYYIILSTTLPSSCAQT